MIKRVILMLGLALLLAVPACAAADGGAQDPYTEEFALSGADELPDFLTDDARRYFEENGVDPADYTWVNRFTGENVFFHIYRFVTTGARAPLRAGAAILGIILIAAAFPALSSTEKPFAPAIYAATLGVAAIVAVPVWSSVSAAVSAVKGCGTFMLSFVPVFASVVAVSGGTVTSVSMSALLLGAAEVVVSIANFTVLPLMGGYLAMSVSTAVSPLINRSGIADGIRKLSLWIMSLVSTLFAGILGIQTAVNSAADSLALKTTKFIVGTSVPVAGAALSEAVSTLSASMSLLRSSVGIYGVAAIVVMLLPFIVELAMWRAVMVVCGTVSDLFAVPKIAGLLKAVDQMLSLLLGAILLTAAMFVISLTVVVSFGRTS